MLITIRDEGPPAYAALAAALLDEPGDRSEEELVQARKALIDAYLHDPHLARR